MLELEIKEDDKYYIAFDYVVDNQDIRNKYRMIKECSGLVDRFISNKNIELKDIINSKIKNII